MLLFVDTDQNTRTGWLGYDIAVNRAAGGSPSRVTVEHAEGTGYRWEVVGDAARAAAGCELELAVPRSLLDARAPPVGFDFKWADNIAESGEWSDFTLNGDAAPNDRFNYRANWPVTAPP